MSSIRHLTSTTDNRQRIPNIVEFMTTMNLAKTKLEKLDYTITPDYRLLFNGSIFNCLKNDEKLEKEKKEAYTLWEKFNVCAIKLGYLDRQDKALKVNDPAVNEKPNNIKTYKNDVNPEIFNDKFTYYKYLTEGEQYTYPVAFEGMKATFDLYEYVTKRGPVVIAQEFYGCGAQCTMESPSPGQFGTDPEYDIYDDRITKIWSEKVNNTDIITIKEYYRANVDTSIRYYENKSFWKSVGSGVYDFIPGIFTYSGLYNDKNTDEGEPALYLFDYKNGIDNVTSANNKTYLSDRYVNNLIAYNDILKQGWELRQNFPAEGGGTKKNILVHRGLADHTRSKGCLTIFNNGATIGDKDWRKSGNFIDFMESFLDNPTADNPWDRSPKSKLGLLFLFKDNPFLMG